MKLWEINLSGEPVRVWSTKHRGVLWFHYNNKTYTYRPASKGAKPSSESGPAHNKVAAPMPGKVLKVHLNVGDKVAVGTPAIAMEAMKMEYSLVTEVAGTVSEIRCQVDDQVGLGQVLVVIDASEES